MGSAADQAEAAGRIEAAGHIAAADIHIVAAAECRGLAAAVECMDWTAGHTDLVGHIVLAGPGSLTDLMS